MGDEKRGSAEKPLRRVAGWIECGVEAVRGVHDQSRPQVELFFDKGLVMAEDPAVRENRLRLLVQLNRDVFTRLAELSEIAVETRGSSNPER